MAKLKEGEEIQAETPNPRSPADQRRDQERFRDEYVEVHEKAAKEGRDGSDQ